MTVTDNMQPSAIYRDVRECEREECLNLWTTVWPGERNNVYFERYFFGDVEWLPYYTQVAEVGGKIVSTVQICKRIVACGEFRLTMGGIANVATLPEYQGKGYNTGCMRRAIGIMEADAMDFSLLFTGINSYYRDFGYADLPRTRASVTVPRAVSRDRVNCRFRVRPAAAGDMPAVRGIYDAFNRDRPIAVQRTEAYWRDWIRIDDAAPPPQLVVAEDGAGTIAGYIRTGVFSSAVPYGAGDSEARIIEFGHAEMPVAGAEDVSLELIRSALDGIPQDRSAVLNLEIPVTPAVRSALIRLAGEDAIKITLSTSGMARLLHPDALLRSFTMAWNDRWKNAGSPGGHAVFATPYGTCTLNADGDFLAVDAGSSDARALAQSDLLGLMFGAATPERITQDAGLSRLLASMLPPSEMVFWGADGF